MVLFGKPGPVFGCHDTYEKMMLKNITHGKGYSSCEYYPECDTSYAPGYIKVNIETREVIEHRESENPCYKGRYSHYAKREILNLRKDSNYRKEWTFGWVKDLYSDF